MQISVLLREIYYLSGYISKVTEVLPLDLKPVKCWKCVEVISLTAGILPSAVH